MEKERTSILLDKDIMLKLKSLAKFSNKSISFLIREALSDYVAKKAPRSKIGIIGIGDSGGSDIVNEKDRYLKGFGKDWLKTGGLEIAGNLGYKCDIFTNGQGW